MISEWPYLLFDFERTGKSRGKFPFNPKLSDTTHRRYLQEDKIFDHEFQGSSLSIRIALLLTLCYLESLSNYIDSFSGVSNVVRTKSDMMLIFGPTK